MSMLETLRMWGMLDMASEYFRHERKITTFSPGNFLMLSLSSTTLSHTGLVGCELWGLRLSSVPVLFTLHQSRQATHQELVHASCFLLSASCCGHCERILHCSLMGTNFYCRHTIVPRLYCEPVKGSWLLLPICVWGESKVAAHQNCQWGMEAER